MVLVTVVRVLLAPIAEREERGRAGAGTPVPAPAIAPAGVAPVPLVKAGTIDTVGMEAPVRRGGFCCAAEVGLLVERLVLLL